ncbi:MAG: type II toxin-antitoxin system HicA family toxin [Cytophagaceae bacterium]|nr:type II toxin-antitoxin system HicA family toxin [Cytophagaceae bacterium]
MDLSPKSLIAFLKERGYELDRISGSHHIFINEKLNHSIPVPIHGNRDLKLGTYKGIQKMVINHSKQ